MDYCLLINNTVESGYNESHWRHFFFCSLYQEFVVEFYRKIDTDSPSNMKGVMRQEDVITSLIKQ